MTINALTSSPSNFAGYQPKFLKHTAEPIRFGNNDTQPATYGHGLPDKIALPGILGMVGGFAIITAIAMFTPTLYGQLKKKMAQRQEHNNQAPDSFSHVSQNAQSNEGALISETPTNWFSLSGLLRPKKATTHAERVV